MNTLLIYKIIKIRVLIKMFYTNNFVPLKIIILFFEFVVLTLTILALIFHISSNNIDDIEKVFPAKLSIVFDILMLISIVIMFSGIILHMPQRILGAIVFQIIFVLVPDAYHFLGFPRNIIHIFHIYTIIRGGIISTNIF